MAGSKVNQKLKVVFLHPDLGIGGAERSMVDAAVSLKRCGHTVHFVTAHHDQNHCFPETCDGTVPVTVVGDWLPRSTFGRFMALWAYLRMVLAAIYLVLFSKLQYDLLIVDQVSHCLPVLKLARAKVVFYCHFPDQLLSSRASYIKKLYRIPLDWMEEWTTGLADVVFVNSAFTADIFHRTFKSLRNLQPEILYPIPNLRSLELPVQDDTQGLLPLNKQFLLSINRYERKKNLALAIKATGFLCRNHPELPIHLIMAGGYDLRVRENVDYFEELRVLATREAIQDNVTFIRSFSDDTKRLLLSRACCLLYTPENEHFGMVPIEAMFMGCPVLACNSGGPLETVRDHVTGFHCEPSAESFASRALQLATDSQLRSHMSQTARSHVQENFSYQAFSRQLNTVVLRLASNKEL